MKRTCSKRMVTEQLAGLDALSGPLAMGVFSAVGMTHQWSRYLRGHGVSWPTWGGQPTEWSTASWTWVGTG